MKWPFSGANSSHTSLIPSRQSSNCSRWCGCWVVVWLCGGGVVVCGGVVVVCGVVVVVWWCGYCMLHGGVVVWRWGCCVVVWLLRGGVVVVW